ncbi:MAG: hypothetical protein WBW80_14925 [Acidimicrobiales bacterium]
MTRKRLHSDSQTVDRTPGDLSHRCAERPKRKRATNYQTRAQTPKSEDIMKYRIEVEEVATGRVVKEVVDAAKGDTVNVDVITELEAVDIDEVHLVGKGANGFPALLAKGLDTSDTITEIDRLLAKADATTDIMLRAGYREMAAALRGAS